MRFLKHLYIGESVHNAEKIKKNLRNNIFQQNVYIISISNSADQLDIIDSKYLLQPFWDRENLIIAGLAGSHNEAIRLVTSMLEKTVRETGTAEVKRYLLKTASIDCEET